MLPPARSALSGRLRAFLLTTMVCSAAWPAAASASADALRDCIDGTLKTSYSVAEYRAALEDMPTDVAEYTDCAAVLSAGRDRALAEARDAGSPYLARSKATALPPARAMDAGNAEGDASPTSPTTPQPEQAVPDDAPMGEDGSMLALPVAGAGGGNGPSGDVTGGLPVLPVVIAFSVIALGGARGLVAWSRRPESLDGVTSSV